MKYSSIARIDWNKLKKFYLIAQFPSLSHAATQLKITQSSLSRSLAELEDMLGMKLFERRTRGVRGIQLLKEGQELLEAISPSFQAFTQYEAHRLDQKGHVQGSLQVSISPVLPVSWLLQGTSSFLQQYPDVQFSLIQSQKESFIQQADCSIQEYNASLGEEIIQESLVSLSYGLYASQSYLDQHGSLNKIEDLQNHPKILLKTNSDAPWRWPESISCDPATSRIHEFSTAQDALWAAQQGLGIAALPRQQVADDPELVALPFCKEDQKVKLCYAYPKSYQHFKRVTLYGEFLTQNLKKELFSTDTLSQTSPDLRGINRRAA